MKKRIIACVGAAALMCSLGLGQAYAVAATGEQGAAGNAAAAITQQRGPRGHAALTEAQKAEMALQRTQREAQLEAFVQTLTVEQKALYEAMQPVKPEQGTAQTPTRHEDISASMKADMKAKADAFIASLTDEQKAAYETLFSMKDGKQRGGRVLTDEQKALMEERRAQQQAQMDAFLTTLNDEQRALYEAMTPVRPEPSGEPPTDNQNKPDESFFTDMKAKVDAFVATLSDEQKTAFEALFGAHGMRVTPLQ